MDNTRFVPEESALDSIQTELPELLKRAYAIPEYKEVIQQYTPALLKQMEQDPEAFEALQKYLARYGIPVEDAERLEPVTTGTALWFIGGAAVGLVIGWLSE